MFSRVVLIWLAAALAGCASLAGLDEFGGAAIDDDDDGGGAAPVAVSYTHLTLPTIYSV